MPPKTLSDWLDTSSSGSGGSNSPVRDQRAQQGDIPHSAESPTSVPKKVSDAERKRQQEAEERRRRQEELKERMRAALGVAAVEKTTVPATGADGKRRHKRRGSATSDDSTFSNVPASRPPQVPHSARSSIDHGVAAEVVSREGQKVPKGDDDDFGIMVADRGTQTSCAAETQTDPDPLILSSPMWYEQYYGHPVAPLHGFLPHASVLHGATASPQHAAASLMSGHAAASFTSGTKAVQSGPAPFNLAVNDFRAQLRHISHAVDSLINKYNLPPPSGLVSSVR